MSCSKMMTMAAIDVVQQADDGDVSRVLVSSLKCSLSFTNYFILFPS
jgi:hypothetical protein